MKNYKLHISDGFKDLYGKEILVKKELENRVLESFKSFGYELIQTPGLEYVDVYSLDGHQKPDLYNLINRQGEVLALSNDMTSSIARFVGSSNTLPNKLKFCYSNSVYRYPRLYQGKNHEFLQAGVELIGEDGVAQDASIIYLAYRTLKCCNVNSFTINIGSSKFLDVLFDDLKISSELKDEIYDCIENNDYVTLRQVLESNTNSDASSFLIDLMMRGGKLKFIEGLINKLNGYKSQEEVIYLKKLYMYLRELDVDNIIFDFSIYPYARYYTGIVFNVYIDNVLKQVISGGRCDNLFKEFGKDLKNIGFGINLDLLNDYVINNNLIDIKKEKYLTIQPDELFVKATINNEGFRKEGIYVNQSSFKSLDEAMKYAKENGYDKVIEYTSNGFDIKEVA